MKRGKSGFLSSLLLILKVVDPTRFDLDGRGPPRAFPLVEGSIPPYVKLME